MPVRRSKGRLRVVGAPQCAADGRRAPIATASRSRLSGETTAARVVRLALALVEVEVSREAERVDPSPSAQDARRRAERRARDLRALLVASGGREAVGELSRALSSDGGALLRACGRAAPDVRDHLVRAAVTFAGIAREHAVTASSGLALLGRSARWSSLAEALLDGVASGGLGVAGVGDRAKLAALAGAQARLDLLSALQLSRSADDARRGAPVVITDEELRRRERAMQARHEREAREAGLLADEGDDAPPDTDTKETTP